MILAFSRALPHVRGGQSTYSPPGNPVYARDMLLFPAEAENCKLGNAYLHAVPTACSLK